LHGWDFIYIQVPKDKIRKVEHIVEALGEWQGTDPQTGFQLVKTAEGTILKIADRVDDNPTKWDNVANTKKDSTYLLAEVEIVATFKLGSVNPNLLIKANKNL
jgi:hypothetical protein